LKTEELKALEKQLKHIVSISNEGEVKRAAEKALHMLPKYQEVNKIIEGLKEQLLECEHFDCDVDFGYKREPGSICIPSSGKTITIRINGGA
jgi:hypothetical protein